MSSKPTPGIRQLPNGRWEARAHVGGRGSRRPGRTFDRKGDAEVWLERMRRERQRGGPLEDEDITLADFFQTYWELHAIPNLARSTRASYLSVWGCHVHDRLGSRELRTLTPSILTGFRVQLERRGVGTATVVRALALVQSILSFAVSEGRLELNPASAVRKPFYERAREPHVFLPADVERIRDGLNPLGGMLVSLLAYAGPRPEEALRLSWRDVGSEALRFDGQKTRRRARGGQRWTPLLPSLAADLREWRLLCGRPAPTAPVIPAHDNRHWQPDDWRNWRRRTWGHYETNEKTRQRVWNGVAPEATRPRDLRSSYITLQIYAGVPLTTLAKQVGTSVEMIDRHYAGVIANWDGQVIPADEQIRRAREQMRAAL